MYWIMLSERSDEYDLSIDETPPLIEQQDLRFDCGDSLTTLPAQIDVPFDIQPDEKMVDNIPAYGCRGLLINKKVKSVFDGMGIKNIQYIKARLINRGNNEILEPYWIANIVGKVACVDREKSELEYYDDGEIKFIDKLVFKPMRKLQYGHIFRYAEFLPIIVISSELKESLERNSVSGFTYYQPEEFSL